MSERQRRASRTWKERRIPARRRDFLMRCIVASTLLGSGAQGWRHRVARAAEPEPEVQVEMQIRRTRLDNGLRVVLSRDISRPTVAICLMYATGARDEAAGQRGSSILIERILARGARPRGGAPADAITASGGRTAAQAAVDRTEFHALLPSNALEIAISASAERLPPPLTPEGFDAERTALLDELRAGSAARAYDGAYGELRSLVFEPTPDGGARSAGAFGDLESITFERARSFLRARYAPNHAVLTLAGNFEVVEALKLIRRHFGQARRTEAPFRAAASVPEQKQPRLATRRDVLARTVGTFSGWAIPPPEALEHHALDLAATILARGDASRLHQLLVRQESLVRDVEAWTDGAATVDLFGLRVILGEGSDPEHVRRLWSGQLGALGRWGPTTGELDRAKNQLRAALARALDGNLARARRLASFELFRGDATELTRELARYMAVTRDDVQRAVGRYLVPARESRVTVMPSEAARKSEGAATSKGPTSWSGEQSTIGDR
jgi:zinc protease